MLPGNVPHGELQNSPEGIPTNILADRLKRLEQAASLPSPRVTPSRALCLRVNGKKEKPGVMFWAHWCDGARNTYLAHWFWNVQWWVPHQDKKANEDKARPELTLFFLACLHHLGQTDDFSIRHCLIEYVTRTVGSHDVDLLPFFTLSNLYSFPFAGDVRFQSQW